MAKNSADSRWREKQGADRFISVLRASQKEGAETSRRKQDKLRYFELLDSAKVESQIIQAPFLGSVAKAQDVASGFEGDHIEFLRSYGSAFVWWMQNKAEKSAKKSAARFASLLQQLAQADEAGRIEELLAANYDGTKLSDESVSKDVLEGRFLAWLAKQK